MSSSKSLAGEVEATITSLYYGKGVSEARQRAQSLGLQTPLWLWTHRKSEGGVPIELKKAQHLIEWFRRNSVPMMSVAVLLPMIWKSTFKSLLTSSESESAKGVDTITMPHIFAHHEMSAINKRDSKVYSYDVVLYIMDGVPSKDSLDGVMQQENYIRDAVHSATGAFLLCADAGWLAPAIQSKWPQWRSVVSKFFDLSPSVSSEGETKPEGVFPHLLGSLLPLCCATHPLQRQLEKGDRTIFPVCERPCMKSMECGQPHHICGDRCHPAKGHRHCPYGCTKTLPCGHPCLTKCSEPCNCYEIIEVPLACTHQEVIGLDPETSMPVYGMVEHIFRGVCRDGELPCSVEYESECALCLGPLKVKCFEAVERHHTLESRTLVCTACQRAEREIRADILGEVLMEVRAKKDSMRKELEKTLYHQKKAAAQGLFSIGARVEIIDPTRCVAPLFDDDFPGLQFVDVEDPTALLRLEGAYGTVVSSHVDVMNRTELRNVVRLPDGLHVIVTDGGLRLIRALTTAVTNKTTLLLENNSTENAAEESVDFSTARQLIGKKFYLSQPIPCDTLDCGSMSDVIVEVTGIDPTSPQTVQVTCRWGTVVEGMEEGQEEPALKKQRTESETVSVTEGGECLRAEALAPLDSLEPLDSFEVGKSVYVTSSTRQITNPLVITEFQRALYARNGSSLRSLIVSAMPVHEDTPYTLVALLNPPFNVGTRLGPCALLRQIPPKPHFHVRHRRFAEKYTTPETHKEKDHNVVSVIPFAFITPDELSAAQGQLDTAALRDYEKKFNEVFKQRCEELALKNEEATFHKQEKLPPVTEATKSKKRTAFSIPATLPTPSQVAEAKKFKVSLTDPSQTSRIASMKSNVAAQKERLFSKNWLPQVLPRVEQELQEEKEYINTINKSFILGKTK